MVGLWRKVIVFNSGDEDLDRRAFNLNVVLLVTLAVFVLGVVALMLQVGDQPPSYILYNTGLLVGVVGILALCYFLSRRGRVQAGSLLYVLLMGAACIGAVFSGGVHGALPALLVVPVATAGITLGSRFSMGLAAFNMVAMITMGVLQYNHVINPDVDQSTIIMLNMFDVGLALFFVCLCIWLHGHGLGQSLERTQKAVVEARQYATAEQERNVHLQSVIEQYVEYMAQVATGDLSVRLALDQDGKDEHLLLLGKRLNDTTASLQRMTAQLSATANDLVAASSKILASTMQQSSGAHEQSEAITQATATIDEVRAIAEQTAQRAQGVADLAQQTATVSHAGRQSISDAVEGMGQIKEKVETIAANVLALSEQSNTIGAIISTVNKIASQSNLLALNAAVEAARAGAVGRGFAVVADEVRSLAGQSRTATVQIKGILSDVQSGIDATVTASEQGVTGADAGMHLVQGAGKSIHQLANDVNASVQAAAQIAAAAQQQLAGMEQIAAAMHNIHQVAAQTTVSAGQSERAAEELNALAEQLRGLVAQYQL